METVWGHLPGEPSCSVRGARRIKRGEPVPEGWVIVKRGNLYDHIKPCSELGELKGGAKEMWLRQNKEEVMEYYEKNGAEATKRRYTLKPETLEAMLGNGRRKPFVTPFTKTDKLELELEIANAGVKELRAEVAELKEQFGNFQQAVSEQLTKNFFLPLLQHGVELSDTFDMKPAPDRLSLRDFGSGKPQRHSRRRAKNLQPV